MAEKKIKPEFPPDFADKIVKEINGFPSDYYSEIGKIVAAWTYLERMIDLAIWKLMIPNLMPMGDVDAAICVTAQIPNMARRFDALLALVKHRDVDKKIVTRINKFWERTNIVSNKRNRVVHDVWGLHDEDGSPIRAVFSAQKKLEFGERPADIKELKGIAEEIIALIYKFQSLLDEIGVEIIRKRDPIWQKIIDLSKKLPTKVGQSFLVKVNKPTASISESSPKKPE